MAHNVMSLKHKNRQDQSLDYNYSYSNNQNQSYKTRINSNSGIIVNSKYNDTYFDIYNRFVNINEFDAKNDGAVITIGDTLDHFSMKQLNIILNDSIQIKYELIKELIVLIILMGFSIGLCIIVLAYYGMNDLEIVSPVTLIVLFGLIYIWIDIYLD